MLLLCSAHLEHHEYALTGVLDELSPTATVNTLTSEIIPFAVASFAITQLSAKFCTLLTAIVQSVLQTGYALIVVKDMQIVIPCSALLALHPLHCFSLV